MSKIEHLHPRVLAYLGDAAFELKVRELALSQGMSQAEELHDFTVRRVKATCQVALLDALEPLLTETEKEIVRQGRNVPVSVGRRSNQALHRKATGFEALFGYWHLGDPGRLAVIWEQIKPVLLEEVS